MLTFHCKYAGPRWLLEQIPVFCRNFQNKPETLAKSSIHGRCVQESSGLHLSTYMVATISIALNLKKNTNVKHLIFLVLYPCESKCLVIKKFFPVNNFSYTFVIEIDVALLSHLAFGLKIMQLFFFPTCDQGFECQPGLVFFSVSEIEIFRENGLVGL